MKRIFIDMDGVLAINTDYEKQNWQVVKMKEGHFLQKEVMPGALAALTAINLNFDMYILSTSVWYNPESAKEKRIWLEKKFGNLITCKLILSHNKGILKGDYIIDDTTAHNVSSFDGEHIQFGTNKFPDWNTVLTYLIP